MVNIDWRLRRLGQTVFTVWAVITLSFFIIRLMPGSAMGALIIQLEQRGLDPQRVRELVELRLGFQPDEPHWLAYLKYMRNTLTGDLGQSAYYAQPVAELYAEALPWTLFILSWATFLSFFIGISIGALMAYWEGGKLDVGMTSYAVLMGSTPFYILAIALIIFVGYKWGLLPYQSRQPTGVTPGFNWPYISGVMAHAALPTASMLVHSGVASLGMRGNSIRVLGEDYLRVARLRGLSDLKISTQYVARNAVLPMYTGLMISIGAMFGGSVILEHIFGYHGAGLLMLRGVDNRDMPLMMGGFIIITIGVVTALLIADLTYGYIDPRARGQDSESY